MTNLDWVMLAGGVLFTICYMFVIVRLSRHLPWNVKEEQEQTMPNCIRSWEKA